MTLKHSQATHNTGIHSIDAGVLVASSSFSTFTAFPNKSSFDSSDVGKIVRVSDTNDRYVMTNHSPATFIKLFGSGTTPELNSLANYTIPTKKNGFITAKRAALSVDMFGADPTGVSSSTDAFEACIAAAISNRSSVEIPWGTYLLDRQIQPISAQHFEIFGHGQASILYYDPNTSGSLFAFSPNGAQPNFKCGIRDLHVTCTNTNVARTCMEIIDISEFYCKNVSINFSPCAGSNSTGVLYRGRDFANFKELTVSADNPFVFGINPHVGGGVLDADAFEGENWCLTCTAPSNGKCIQIANGWANGPVKLFGFQAWQLGKYGLYWYDNTSTQAAQLLYVNGGRWEGTTDPDGFGIYVNKTSPAQGGGLLVISNFCADTTYATGSGGIYIRSIGVGGIRDSKYIGNGVALDIDESCGYVTTTGCAWHGMLGTSINLNDTSREVFSISDNTNGGERFVIYGPISGSTTMKQMGQSIFAPVNSKPTSVLGADGDFVFSTNAKPKNIGYKRSGTSWYAIPGIIASGSTALTATTLAFGSVIAAPTISVECVVGDFVDVSFSPILPDGVYPFAQVINTNVVKVQLYCGVTGGVTLNNTYTISVRVRPNNID